MFILFILRFFVFKLYESPKYLMGRGRDAEAVEVVHKLAAYNGKTSSLKLGHLKAAEEVSGAASRSEKNSDDLPVERNGAMDTSARAAIERQLSKFSMDHVRSLFATRKLAWSTSLLIVLWGEKASHTLHKFD